MQTEHQLTFDRYRLDLTREQLWWGSQEIPLPGKAFALLRYLIEHAGQLVSKAEVFAALWLGTAVTDGALTFCLVELRKALGDNARAPQFVETVHRRGYRFITEVISSQHSVVSSQNEANQKAKGKNQKAKVEDLSPAPSTQHPAPTLVGRETELAQLHSWLDKALDGERQIVFVTGEPGIGKTTLIEAFRQRLGIGDWRLVPSPQTSSLQPLVSPVWLGRGQCIEQYGPGEAYMPILEALGRLCRASDGEQLVTLLKQHAPTWLVQMPALLSAAELEVLQRQTQGVTRERMLREMGEAVAAITAERPLILWLEDLHWSDASTLELLALLARRREPARLLVIGTYRPVDVIVQAHPLRAVKQELQLHGLCEELPLGLLSETQVAEYLEHRFVVGAQHPAFLQILAKMIHHRTDGNPLFMVTAVEDLIAQNVFVQNDGQWAVQEELAAIETRVPDNLQQLIAQQIERMRAEDRRMLEVASVAGMEFSAAAVAVGVEAGAEVVEEQCAGLARRGQFPRAQGTADWPDGTIAARYSFLHALYQEVLYNRIPAGRRQRLHQRIGERQEAAYGKRAREIASELAMHFEQGRDYGKAVQYLQQAGENALRRSAYVEAVNHFTKGLELLKTLPETPERMQQELTLQTALGVPLMATRGYSAPEVGQAYARARELCQQIGDTPQLFPVLCGLSVFYAVGADLQTARELGTQCLHLARRVQDSGLLLEVHAALGPTSFYLGKLLEARAHMEEAIALYDPQQHHSYDFVYGTNPAVVALGFVARTLCLLGYLDQARQRGNELLAMLQELSAHHNSLGADLMHLTVLHLLLRDGHPAREQVEALITLATEHELLLWLGMATMLRGAALVEEACLSGRQEEIEEGIAQLRQGIASYRSTGAGLDLSPCLVTLAQGYRAIGQPQEGLSVLADALVIVNNGGERYYEAELYRFKGVLTLQAQTSLGQIQGKFQTSQKSKRKSQKSKNTDPRSLTPDPQGEAEACFLKALEVSRHQQAKSLELRATMSLARLWQQQRKHQEAHQMLSDIYGWFTEGFDTKDLQEARTLLEELT